MRRVKTAFGLATAVCAFGIAATATSAVAANRQRRERQLEPLVSLMLMCVG